MDNLRTFSYYKQTRNRPTYAEALGWNEMMVEPTADFLQMYGGHRHAVKSTYLSELWCGLVGTQDMDTAKTKMPACVDCTMPVNYVPVIRMAAGTAAAFAYCEIVKQLVATRIDLADDFEVRQVMVRAWENFEQRRQEANQVREGFGFGGPQSWHTLRDIGTDPKSKLLKDKMLAIARLAGRMFESFGYQHREHPNDAPEEVKGATMGGDISRVLPTELALLADPDTEDAQAMKILSGNAYIQEMEGVEEKKRGPLVLCIDESGSMHDGDLGTNWMKCEMWTGRNTWAKACAVALTRIAWAENRPVRCVHFGDGTVPQEVPKDDARALFEMSRSFMGGSTSFGGALSRSRRVVGDLKADGFDGADIVLITDGQDSDHSYHNRQLDKMDQDKIKLWTVAIGGEIFEGHPVRARAEKYTYAHDRQLSDPKTAVHLAEGLDKAALSNDLCDGETMH